MKALFSLVMLGSFIAAMAGCSFNADVDPKHDDVNRKTSTTTDVNGRVIEKTTKTETVKPY